MRLVNHGACVWLPRAANHICQSSLGWWGVTTGGGALRLPGLYINSISCKTNKEKKDEWCKKLQKKEGQIWLWITAFNPYRQPHSPSMWLRHGFPRWQPRAARPRRSSFWTGRTSWPAGSDPPIHELDALPAIIWHESRNLHRWTAPGDGKKDFYSHELIRWNQCYWTTMTHQTDSEHGRCGSSKHGPLDGPAEPAEEPGGAGTPVRTQNIR